MLLSPAVFQFSCFPENFSGGFKGSRVSHEVVPKTFLTLTREFRHFGLNFQVKRALQVVCQLTSAVVLAVVFAPRSTDREIEAGSDRSGATNVPSFERALSPS